MTKQFWIFLVVGLAIVAAGVYGVLVGTKGAHIDLAGEILKVRVLSVNPEASLVIVDFRVTNPADYPFVVSAVQMELDRAGAETVEGQTLSKSDVDIAFKYGKLLGTKYNDVLIIRDKIAPHQTVDRMAGARFELPESQIEARKAIRLRIEEIDNAVVEIGEKK